MTRKADQLRVLDQLTPPDLWTDIRGREPRRSVEDLSDARSSGARRAAVAVFALVISTAAVAFAVRAFQASERSTQPARTIETPVSPSMIDLTAQVTGRIRLGGIPGSVAASAGSVWVTTYNYEDGQAAVVRIDSITNEVVATIPIDDIAYNLAVGSGAVWVPTGTQPSVELLRIDASTNEVTGRVAGVHGPIVVDATGVWAIEDGEDERDAAVVRINPATLQIDVRIPVGESPFDMTAGAGSVWLVTFAAQGDDRAGTGSVLRIDAISGEVAATIPIKSSGIWMAADDSGLWVPAQNPDDPRDSGAYFIDASTNAVSGEPGDVYNFRPFAIAEGRVWFISGPEDQGLPRGVCGLNVNTRTVDVCAELDSAPDLEFAHDPAALEMNTLSIWLGAFEEPWITRVDIVPTS